MNRTTANPHQASDDDASINNDPLTQLVKPVQLVFSIPTSPDTRVHLHITNLQNSLVVLLASSPTPPSLGSFVYALPNISSPSTQPLSTPLYSRPSSVDFIQRVAKILARRSEKPVYVGGELKFWTQEDESIALRGVVDTVMEVIKSDTA